LIIGFAAKSFSWVWGSGEVGRWGSGEVGKWGSGKAVSSPYHPKTLSPVSRLLIAKKLRQIPEK